MLICIIAFCLAFKICLTSSPQRHTYTLLFSSWIKQNAKESINVSKVKKQFLPGYRQYNFEIQH